MIRFKFDLLLFELLGVLLDILYENIYLFDFKVIILFIFSFINLFKFFLFILGSFWGFKIIFFVFK